MKARKWVVLGVITVLVASGLGAPLNTSAAFVDNQITEFHLQEPNRGLCSQGGFGLEAGRDSCITAGSDGALWFAEPSTQSLGRITTGGVVTEFPLPCGNVVGDICLESSGLNLIVSGSDGDLYVAAGLIGVGSGIVRVTTAGVVHGTFVIPGGAPSAMTRGPDGKVWFGTFSSVGALDPLASLPVVEYPLPTPGSGVPGMTAGPGNSVWFTERLKNVIGRIDAGTGVITEFPYLITNPGFPPNTGQPALITNAPDGTLWFNDYQTLASVLYGIQGSGPNLGAMEAFSIANSGLRSTDCPAGVQGCFMNDVAAPIVAGDGNLYIVSEDNCCGWAGGIRRLGGPPAITTVFQPGVTPVLDPTVQEITVRDVYIPPSLAVPSDLTLGPDGNLWYTAGRCVPCGSIGGQDTSGNLIGVLNLTPTPPPPPLMGVTVDGVMSWSDTFGGIHPLQNAPITIMDAEADIDRVIGLGMTDANGHYSVHVPDNNDGPGKGGYDVYARLRPDAPGFTFDDPCPVPGGIGCSVHQGDLEWRSTVMNNVADGAVLSFSHIALNTEPLGEALSIQQALITGLNFVPPLWRTAVPVFEVAYPAGKVNGCAGVVLQDCITHWGTTALPPYSKKELFVTDDDWQDWDIVLHEFTHLLGQTFGWDAGPGGSHNIDTVQLSSTVGGNDIGKAARLAWSEGVADFLGATIPWAMGVSDVPFAGENCRLNRPDLGPCPRYEDTKPGSNLPDIEESLAEPHGVGGEDQEMGIARFLFHLAADNRLPGQPPRVRTVLINLIDAHAVTLNQFVAAYPGGKGDIFYGQAGSLGPLLERQNVAPTDISVVYQDWVHSGRTHPPTISWRPSNGKAILARNDKFRVVVTGSMRDGLKLDSGWIAGSTFTPSQQEWQPFALADDPFLCNPTPPNCFYVPSTFSVVVWGAWTAADAVDPPRVAYSSAAHSADGGPPPGVGVDTDGDGFSDVIEGAYLSNPADPTSRPVVPPGEIADPMAATAPEVDCGDRGRGINTCIVRPGDIILWRKTGSLQSLAENFLGATYYTHALMVIGRFDIRPEAKPKKIEVVVADITPGRSNGTQFALSSFDLGLDSWEPDQTDALGVYRPLAESSGAPVREIAARKLLNYALAKGASLPANRHAGWWDVSRVSYSKLPTATKPDKFYCSSLVAWAYSGVFQPPFAGPVLLPPYGSAKPLYTTPDDLLDGFSSRPTLVEGFNTDAGIIAVFSPAHLIVTDPQGRREGVAADNTVLDEIPGALVHQVDTHQGVSAPGMGAGWTVTLSGYAEGRYTLLARTLSGGQVSDTTALLGWTHPGLIETYGFASIPALKGRPSAVDDYAPGAADRSVPIAVLANDVDPDGNLDAGSLRIVTGPGHGTASTDGSRIVYSADQSFLGRDSFSYEVCDTTHLCARALVRLATPRLQLVDLRGRLSAFPNPTERDHERLTEATQHFAYAADPALWQTDDTRLSVSKGARAFDEVGLALRALRKIPTSEPRNESGSTVREWTQNAVSAVRFVVDVTLADAATGDPIMLSRALREEAAAEAELSHGDVDAALHRLRTAWMLAEAAAEGPTTGTNLPELR